MKQFFQAFTQTLHMRSAISAELQALQHNFEQAWRFFSSHTKTEPAPWYLLLGASQTGKTALLTHSGLPFADTEQLTHRDNIHLNESHHCNWWFNPQGIILDIPGSYIDPESAMLWRYGCQLLKKHRQRIQGIIVTISVADLLQLSKIEQKTQAQQIRTRLQELSLLKFKRPIPIHIMLTKADMLAGFVEFFDDLGREEHTQPLGIIFTPTTTSLVDSFLQEFDALLKRLHHRVIWRLHQERNLNKRTLIHDFPLQMALLKEQLAAQLHLIADPSFYTDKFYLAGLYFVSSQQQGTPIDGLLRNINLSFPITSALVAYSPPTSHSFFTETILKSILRQAAPKPAVKINQQKLPLVLLTLLTVFSLGSSFYLFKWQYQPYKQAQLALQHYQSLVPAGHTDLAQVVTNLTALQQSLTALQHIHSPAFIDFTAHRTLAEKIQKTYQQHLSNDFMPSLFASVEGQLHNNTLREPNQLYATLMLYLMLADPEHRNLPFIDNWFKNYWQQTYKTNPQVLLQHLHIALAQKTLTMPALNTALVAQAREVLNTIPYPMLAYTMLQNQHAGIVQTFSQMSNIPNSVLQQVFGSIPPAVPSVYTAGFFKNIYQQEIPALEQTLANSNWVLGNSMVSSWWTRSANQLIPTIRNLYIQDYANWWLGYLRKLQPQKPNDMIQLNTQLTALSGHTIERLWQTLNNNVNFNDMPEVQALLHKELPILSIPGLQQIQYQTNHLQAIIYTLVNDDNYPEAVFNFAKARMRHTDPADPMVNLRNLALQTPPAVQTWLTTIVDNTWSLLLLTTQKHIDNIWQATVMPFYNNYIVQRYPLYKPSQQNIALRDFAHFFGPRGVLDDFFFSMLKPFVDTTQARWQWRMQEGQFLKLPNEVILQFERAGIIRKMFFDENEQLQVTYALLPTDIDPAIKHIALNIDGQKTNIPGDKPSDLQWPGTANNNIAQLFYEGEQSGSLSANGPWALFRLLDNAQLKPSQDIRHFEVSFNLAGSKANFDLVAARLINPFIPGILDQFHCPLNFLPVAN